MPIGESSYCTSMLKPIINSVSCKLAAWKGNYLSIGGNNLPIYYLFLAPIPITIDAKIKKQIKPFLWFGEEGGKNYAMLNGFGGVGALIQDYGRILSTKFIIKKQL